MPALSSRHITLLQPITVEFNVAEDDVPQIVQAVHNGKQLTVDAYDRANKKKLATGTLGAFNSQIDPTTGTLRLRAVFKNDDDSLFPNQFVRSRSPVRLLSRILLLRRPAQVPVLHLVLRQRLLCR
jgi:multidrug efflux system membrane fusion protein